MATYIITINLDNDAFCDGREGVEIANILGMIGAECVNDGVAVSMPIYDINGNRVGEAKRKGGK